MRTKSQHAASLRLKAEYEKLNDEGKRLIREKIMNRCNWSDKTFYRRLDNPVDISPVEREEICEIVGLSHRVLFPNTKVIKKAIAA